MSGRSVSVPRLAAVTLASSLLMLTSNAGAVGEAVAGFPNWAERVEHEWTNRARVDPALEMTKCGAPCGEKACYTPKPPIYWSDQLGHSSRFHSRHMSQNGYFNHPSACALVAGINTLYPGTCNAPASCSCVGGTLTGTTDPFVRISMFGATGSGEIIATPSDPNTAFYLWLYESSSSTACTFSSANGHRMLILTSTSNVGFGVDGYSTGDFGTGGTASKIASGSHYPRNGASVELWANWYDTAAPSVAQVNVGGTCKTMALTRGTGTNGAWLYTATGLTGCTRYFFSYKDSAGTAVTWPSTGSLGIGDTTCADWDTTRPTGCGPCTPACSGKTCGPDGCGGSCGTCTAPATCSGSGTCACTPACSGKTCGADGCGGSCGTCTAPATCSSSGTCVCTPACSGKTCGPDGCGGSCGTCTAPATCSGSGTCVCTPACTGKACGPDGCGGSCGTCPTGQVCNTTTSTCVSSCTPSCTGKTCGDDGCGGSCGTCPTGKSCSAGTCVCAPSCTGKTCGGDGCGGICGSCTAPMTCDTTGNCACAAPNLMCGGVCLDVTSDPANCGACGTKCAAGEVCDKSTCKGSCTAPLVDCGGACVDLKTDPLHCGKCDGTCSPLETCLAGTCTKKDADAGSDAGTDAATDDGSVDDTGFASDSGTGSDATLGDGALGDSPTDTGIHGSCGCETPGGQSSSPSSAKWLTLAGLAFLGLRRRKRN